jgi:hypothetical protein
MISKIEWGMKVVAGNRPTSMPCAPLSASVSMRGAPRVRLPHAAPINAANLYTTTDTLNEGAVDPTAKSLM